MADIGIRCVLVVEDEEDQRELLATLLTSEGHVVEAVGDGLLALEAIDRGARPFVIVLDYRMPQMDAQGLHTALRDRPNTAKVPLILVSGEPALEEKARSLDAAVLLPKPVDPGLLCRAVARYA